MSRSLVPLEEFRPPAIRSETGPAIDRAEHAALCDEAYRRGLSEGAAEARAEIAAETRDAVRALSFSLSENMALREGIAQELTEDFAKALAAAVRAISPALAQRGLADAVRRAIEDELGRAPRPLTLHVAPGLRDDLETALADLDGIGGVEADGSLTGTRVEIRWPDGSATIDPERTAARILELADTLETAAPEGKEEHV